MCGGIRLAHGNKGAMLGDMARHDVLDIKTLKPGQHSLMADGCEIVCCRRVGKVAGGAGLGGESSAVSGMGANRTGFVSRPGFDEFRQVLGTLRAVLPAAKPVVVRTSWLAPDLLGQCVRRPSRFVITLNRDLREGQAIETLLHEWAHALAWNYSLDSLAKKPTLEPGEFERACHDEAWGCAYSRVWRAYLTPAKGLSTPG